MCREQDKKFFDTPQSLYFSNIFSVNFVSPWLNAENRARAEVAEFDRF